MRPIRRHHLLLARVLFGRQRVEPVSMFGSSFVGEPPMSMEAFLKIWSDTLGDCKGQSTDLIHRDWIDLLTFSGVTPNISAQPDSSKMRDKIQFFKWHDRASPYLFRAAESSAPLALVILHRVETSDDRFAVPLPQKMRLPPSLFFQYHGGMIESVEAAQAANGTPIEKVTMSYDKVRSAAGLHLMQRVVQWLLAAENGTAKSGAAKRANPKAILQHGDDSAGATALAHQLLRHQQTDSIQEILDINTGVITGRRTHG